MRIPAYEPYGGTLVSHINQSQNYALIIYFRVGDILYREMEKVLAPTSFAMALKKTEEECSQELNKRMNALIGYCEEDWNQC